MSGPLPPPGLASVTCLTVLVAPPIEAGATGQDVRRIIPITGGTAEGPGFCGIIEPGGSGVRYKRVFGFSASQVRTGNLPPVTHAAPKENRA